MPAEINAALVTAPKKQLYFFIAPVLAAIYPLPLKVFHSAALSFSEGADWQAWLVAATMLVLALSVPLIALIIAMHLSTFEKPTAAQLYARRISLLAVATPPIFTLTGVIFLLAGKSSWDTYFLALFWMSMAVIIATADNQKPLNRPVFKSHSNWKKAHGFVAIAAIVYLAFHFSNHLFGLIGAEAHMAVMKIFRLVYRAALVEPVLILCFVFLIISGGFMAWRLTGKSADRFRTFQMAAGVYLIFAIISHVNAVLYLARIHFGIDTDWAFAVGAPVGILKDPWSIRLLPYYLLAVFFVIAHAFSGLRVVLLAHNVKEEKANRVFFLGVSFAAIVATIIILGMCGLRIYWV